MQSSLPAKGDKCPIYNDLKDLEAKMKRKYNFFFLYIEYLWSFCYSKGPASNSNLETILNQTHGGI